MNNKIISCLLLFSLFSSVLFGSGCNDQNSFVQIWPGDKKTSGEVLTHLGIQFNGSVDSIFQLNLQELEIVNGDLKNEISLKFEYSVSDFSVKIKATKDDSSGNSYTFTPKGRLGSKITKTDFIFQTSNMIEAKTLSFDKEFFIKTQIRSELISIPDGKAGSGGAVSDVTAAAQLAKLMNKSSVLKTENNIKKIIASGVLYTQIQVKDALIKAGFINSAESIVTTIFA